MEKRNRQKGKKAKRMKAAGADRQKSRKTSVKKSMVQKKTGAKRSTRRKQAKSKKEKTGISIRFWVYMPLFILGIAAVLSNILAVYNINRVNGKATEISDEYFVTIMNMAEIQDNIRQLHNRSLSHVSSKDMDTMITLTAAIQEQEKMLDEKLEEYEKSINEDFQKNYVIIKRNYEHIKEELADMLALSAINHTDAAYAVANGDLSNYMELTTEQISAVINVAEKSTNSAKSELSGVYSLALTVSIVAIIACTAAICFAMLIIQFRIIRPITQTAKDISVIIREIDDRQGDLTRRIRIRSNDEIAALGKGINAFLEKLQSIFGMVSKSSIQMDEIASVISDSVSASNNSVTDLSALTEELSATMTEVGRNAYSINENAISVTSEVMGIADRTSEINNYSKEMKVHADQIEKMASDNMRQTQQKVSEIMASLNQAIEESKSVDRIDSLTGEIMNIADQTNLLAINASIEAARAGEVGRGFAVVASEITHLSAESQKSAENIQQINSVITAAVHNLADHANDLIVYLRDSILNDFSDFVDAGKDYKQNAAYIENVMNEFMERTENLRKSVSEIADSIQLISDAIEDGTTGVTNTADSMQVLASDIDNISRETESNLKIANLLKKETEIFSNL